MKHEEITRKIIAAAYKVHNTLGSGFLEKVYENAMLIELSKAGLSTQSQCPIKVFYDNYIVGEFFSDLFVDRKVIVELKANLQLKEEHELQLVNYLNVTGIDIGLLINFGSSVMVKRKFRKYIKNK